MNRHYAGVMAGAALLGPWRGSGPGTAAGGLPTLSGVGRRVQLDAFELVHLVSTDWSWPTSGGCHRQAGSGGGPAGAARSIEGASGLLSRVHRGGRRCVPG